MMQLMGIACQLIGWGQLTDRQGNSGGTATAYVMGGNGE
jgi:hypothetical protein